MFDRYTALEAADAGQALELARQDPPDVVLLGIMMPGMDGYEVTRAHKADAATKAIPIMMVTSLDDRDSRRAMSWNGCKTSWAPLFPVKP